jgi:hypothetical protein
MFRCAVRVKELLAVQDLFPGRRREAGRTTRGAAMRYRSRRVTGRESGHARRRLVPGRTQEECDAASSGTSSCSAHGRDGDVRERRRPHLEDGERFAIDLPGAGCPRWPPSVPPVILRLARRSRVYAPGGGRAKVSAYEPGRICAAEGCGTILSTYNPWSRCALHHRLEDVTRKQHTQRPLEERHCLQCGHPFATTSPTRRFCSDSCRMAAFQHRRNSAPLRTRDH